MHTKNVCDHKFFLTDALYSHVCCWLFISTHIGNLENERSYLAELEKKKINTLDKQNNGDRPTVGGKCPRQTSFISTNEEGMFSNLFCMSSLNQFCFVLINFKHMVKCLICPIEKFFYGNAMALACKNVCDHEICLTDAL